MDFSCFSNREELERIERCIQAIDPGLSINMVGTGWIDSYAIQIGVTIPQKGNKKIIDQLVRMGFSVKGKRASNSGWMAYNYGEPRRFLVDLVMRLPPPKEVL